ncbi:MAG: helix-turn-helix domain-containing protein [Selenomonadaceae bacterium]|nr:helix-turn-helix domain-containing protein [Selenomonadaceae bacterium]
MGGKISIGQFIKDRRIALGITQREVALSIGVTEASVSRWESGGIGNMRRDRIAKLAKALRIPPTVLLEGNVEADSVNQDGVVSIPKNYGLQTVKNVMRSVGKDVRLVPRIGAIACGSPILAEENLDGYEYIDSRIKADFALTVKGDSMIDVGIQDGYTVFIKQTEDVDNGDIAAVLIDGEATLKRVYKEQNGMVLIPANKKYRPRVITEADGQNVRILGKAVAIKGEL